MSTLNDCCTPCPSVTAVNVPGTPGQNAFTTTTTATTLPAQNNTVIVAVANCQWMAVGQIVFISDGTHLGTFSVASTPVSPFTSVSLKFLLYTGDSAPAVIIASGATVTPAGIQANITYPTSVANGGTGAATAATARSNLGAAASGANTDITSLNGLTTPLSVSQGGTGVTTIAGLLSALAIQSGTALLALGVKTISTGITITANSIIVVTLKTPGGTRTAWAGYVISAITPGGPGVGAFTITAISDTAGNATTLALLTDTVFYHIIG